MADEGLGEIGKQVGENVAAALRRARASRGWRQEDLARESGIAQPMISKYERGISTPSIAELAWLERALDLPAGLLFVEAKVVPPTTQAVHAITADPDLGEPERDLVLKAYWVAVRASQAEQSLRKQPEVPGRPRRRDRHR